MDMNGNVDRAADKLEPKAELEAELEAEPNKAELKAEPEAEPKAEEPNITKKLKRKASESHICLHCDYKTDRDWRLYNHTETKHPEHLPSTTAQQEDVYYINGQHSHVCDLCEYAANRSSRLAKHVKMSHSGLLSTAQPPTAVVAPFQRMFEMFVDADEQVEQPLVEDLPAAEEDPLA